MYMMYLTNEAYLSEEQPQFEIEYKIAEILY